MTTLYLDTNTTLRKLQPAPELIFTRDRTLPREILITPQYLTSSYNLSVATA